MPYFGQLFKKFIHSWQKQFGKITLTQFKIYEKINLNLGVREKSF